MYYISYYINTLYVLHIILALHALYMQLVPSKRLLLIIIYVWYIFVYWQRLIEMESNRNISFILSLILISSSYSLYKSIIINNILWFMFIIFKILIVDFFFSFFLNNF